MNTLLPAYKTISEGRYREISGLYWEDFHPGDVLNIVPAGRFWTPIMCGLPCSLSMCSRSISMRLTPAKRNGKVTG